MKHFIFCLVLSTLIFCNNPTEPPPQKQSKTTVLTASVVSGYHKICRKGVTVDSFPITPDDSVYKLLHNWDTIVIKSDTLFLKIIRQGVTTYIGYSYKSINDSIQLSEIGLFDSKFVRDTTPVEQDVFMLKGSLTEIYTNYAQVVLYSKGIAGWFRQMWYSTIINNVELNAEYNSADSAEGSFCRIVFK